MTMKNLFINTSAFWAGCFPVALMEFVCVMWFGTNDTTKPLYIFAYIFLFVTIISTLCFIRFIKNTFSKANTPGSISNIKRKDIFSSGAISYYILPFISFVGSDSKSMVTLIIVILILTLIFNNNMMFMYTPILDFFQYKVLECDLQCGIDKHEKVIILVKSDTTLYFTGTNNGVFKKVQEGLYFFVPTP